MRPRGVCLVWPALFVSLAVPAAADAPPKEPVDLRVVARIREEALQRSHVPEVVEHLSEHIGARLTGTAQVRQAAEWTREKLASWGLANARLEPWGPFGRGWVVERCAVSLLTPAPSPLVALPRAFTPGTSGPVRGRALHVRLESEGDLEEQRGKLRGRFLLLRAPREIKPETEAAFRRYTDAELRELEGVDLEAEKAARAATGEAIARRIAFARILRAYLVQEGVLATLEPSSAPAGLVRVMGNGTAYVPGDPVGVPALIVAADHYNRVVRLADAGANPELEIDVSAQFTAGVQGGRGAGSVSGPAVPPALPATAQQAAVASQEASQDASPEANVLAEIPGGDLRDEVVMMGAHLDSWHGGTGATDNAAGVAVVMEAARILQSLGLRSRRTIRLALWTGEEQGLLGSRAYVGAHFASRSPRLTKVEHARLSGYFNVDDGTGRIRGIYTESNATVAPIFSAWLAPFRDLGAESVTLRHSAGSDHESFDEVGLPGFIFMQDRAGYDERTHHTNIDGFDRVIPADLKQASAILASFVYHAAMRDTLLPRKPR